MCIFQFQLSLVRLLIGLNHVQRQDFQKHSLFTMIKIDIYAPFAYKITGFNIFCWTQFEFRFHYTSFEVVVIHIRSRSDF